MMFSLDWLRELRDLQSEIDLLGLLKNLKGLEEHDHISHGFAASYGCKKNIHKVCRWSFSHGFVDDLCGNIRSYWGQQCSFLESSSSQKKGGSVHLEGPLQRNDVRFLYKQMGHVPTMAEDLDHCIVRVD